MTSVHYPEDPASVAQARAFVATQLSRSTDEVRDRAVLITSELASNAVVHARSAFTVTTSVTDDEVSVRVTDTGGTVPIVRRPGATDLHGRGLMIVNNLADRWGVDLHSQGKTVWFALAQ